MLRELCDPVIVVCPEDARGDLEALGIQVVLGGESRQQSVANGLEHVTTEHVVIHDAARPFVTADVVAAAIDALDQADGSFAAIPVRETLAHMRDDVMTGVVPRDSILSVQTPQAFSTMALKDAHEKARSEGIVEASDDAQLVANYGYRVVPIQGDARNMKLTYAPDFEMAAALIEISG